MTDTKLSQDVFILRIDVDPFLRKYRVLYCVNKLKITGTYINPFTVDTRCHRRDDLEIPCSKLGPHTRHPEVLRDFAQLLN